jgi:hypothetical protein
MDTINPISDTDVIFGEQTDMVINGHRDVKLGDLMLALHYFNDVLAFENSLKTRLIAIKNLTTFGCDFVYDVIGGDIPEQRTVSASW